MSQNPNHNTIPPKPSDINSQQALMETDSSSFKDKLMANEPNNNISIQSLLPHQNPMETNLTLSNEDIQSHAQHSDTYTVPITKEDNKEFTTRKDSPS